MANGGHNRLIIADFHGAVITIVWLCMWSCGMLG